MPDDSQVQPEVPEDPVVAQDPPVVEVPKIDFSKPTGDPLVGIRKGFGLTNVGGTGPAAPAEPAAVSPEDPS